MIDKRRCFDEVNERRDLDKMYIIVVNRRQLIIDDDVFLVDKRRDLDEINERYDFDEVDVIVINRR